jgi:hypothetical protein
MHFAKRHHSDLDKLFHQNMAGFECRHHIASLAFQMVAEGVRIDGSIRNYKVHSLGEIECSFGIQGLSETHHK